MTVLSGTYELFICYQTGRNRCEFCKNELLRIQKRFVVDLRMNNRHMARFTMCQDCIDKARGE